VVSQGFSREFDLTVTSELSAIPETPCRGYTDDHLALDRQLRAAEADEWSDDLTVVERRETT
jgi:hypothetical protein